MDQQGPEHHRRGMMKIVAGSLMGASATGTALTASANREEVGVNTNFDPSRKNETVKFAKTFNELSTDKQEKLWNELNQRQKRAFHKVNIPTSASSQKTNIPRPLSGWDYSDVYQFDLKGTGGVKVFSLYHEIKWDTEDGEVIDADNNGWVDDLGWFWSDEGNRKSRIYELEDGTDADVHSARKRKVVYMGGRLGTFTYYPETITFARGTPISSGVYECDDGGVGNIINKDNPYVCGSRSTSVSVDEHYHREE